MKRCLIISLCAFWVLSLIAQTQRGVAYRYNGKDPHTPLGKVYIKAAIANNGVLSDSVSGWFTLQFHGLSMGSRIGNVQVQKRGMMIFNQQAVDEWNIRKEPLRLILCDVDEFEKQKQNLITIGQQEAKRRYERKIAEIESKYKSESAEWYQKLSEADEEFQKVRKHLGEYADLFARIDESEIDTLAQYAIALFKKGNIEEAVRLFENGNYLEKLKSVNRAINQGEQLINAINQDIEKSQKSKSTYINGLKAQVDAYKLQGEFEKAGKLLKDLADELKTFDDYNEYAWFCKTQHIFSEAENYYRKMLEMLDFSQDSLQSKIFSYSAIYHSLGELYMDMEDYQKSEEMLMKALFYRKELFKQDSLAFMAKLSYTLNDLGLLYSNISESEQAKYYFGEALSIKRKIYEKDSVNNDIDLVKTLCNLGNLFIRDYEYEKSESLLNEALSILLIFPIDTDEYKDILAITYNSLGILYNDMKELDKSEDFLLKALAIRKDMAQKNPDAYTSKYALPLTNVAIMYCKKGDYETGEKLFLEAKGIYEELAKRNPAAYESGLSRTYGNLGILYKLSHRYHESANMYDKNIAILKRKYQFNPMAYGGSYANSLANYAVLYDEMERVDSQLVLLKESYSIFNKLVQNNPHRFERDFADVILELGNVMFVQKSYKESVRYYGEVIPLLREFVKTPPNQYLKKLSSSLIFISSAEIFNKEYCNAESYAREGVEVNSNEEYHFSNLATSLLFQGKYTEAKAIYKKYKDEYRNIFLDDLKQFAEAGVIPPEREADVENIRKMLNE